MFLTSANVMSQECIQPFHIHYLIQSLPQPWEVDLITPYLTGEQTQIQRGQVTGPRSKIIKYRNFSPGLVTQDSSQPYLNFIREIIICFKWSYLS